MKYLSFLLVLVASAANAATAWETYLDNPTPANAALVKSISYSHPLEGGYDAGDLQILRLQILAGDPESFRLGYRLYAESDGGLGEDLGVILAGTIRPHPTLFLEQIIALKLQCSNLHWVVNAPGLEYDDRPTAMAYEIRMRIKALQGVTDGSLVKVRDECIAEIDPP